MQPNFNMEQAARMLNEYKGGHETLPVAWDVVDDFVAEYQGKRGVVQAQAEEFSDAHTQFSVRTKEPPKKVGIAYKVFYQKNGKLYPPMVANPGGADTPVGVWLDADIGVSAPPSKTGRLQVKAGGKGTQGGSGSLAFRPGWHLGDIPKATQFDRKNPANGVKELFPKDFVWAECEYAMDVDYQEEAMSYGYTENGKFRHSYAGLPRLPEDGYYHYRTNPDPKTVPWVITGAMKVTRILSREDVDAILAENGVEPTKWQGENGEMELTGVGGNVQYSPRNSNDPDVASIKDQLRKVQAELNNMAVVASVTAPEMTGWNKKKQKIWVLDNLKYTGYKVDVMNFGVIEFGEKQIDKSLDYLKREEEVAAFLALPKVLKRGMQVAGHDNHKGRQFDTVTFAAPVSINGVRGNMAVVVKQLGRNLYKTHRILMPDGSSFSYEDKKMQRRNLADGIPPETMAQVPRHNSADFSIQQRRKSVNENLKFSLRTPAPATTRDYLLSLPDADLTTEGQKDAMRRYRAYVDELRGLEEQRATQEELSQTQMPPMCRMPRIRSMLAAFFMQYRRKRLTTPAKNGTL